MITQTLRHGRRLLINGCKISYQQQNLVRSHATRCSLSTSAINFKRVGPYDPDEGYPPQRTNFKQSLLPDDWHKLIERYPEFLPDPINSSPLLVSRMLDDMLKRRAVIEIPEFYVGSILAVTVTDQYSETKKSKFVGICIHRTGQLKFANFTLRNIIDGMGCEIRYDLYNPLILSIEVLRLEKRLDDTLIYLRDALPEYSTIPEDMKPEVHEDGAEVPLNKTLVKMKPQPWSRRWERWLFQGVEKFENIPQWFGEKVKKVEDDPVYSFDLMREYRTHCTEEMMYNICKRLMEHEKTVVAARKVAKAKRFLRVTKKVPPSAEASA